MSFSSCERLLAQDLLDAMWLEDLYGFRQHCTFRSLNERGARLEVTLDNERSLWWSGRRVDGLRPFRVSDAPLVLRMATQVSELSLVDAVDALQTAAWWIERSGRFGRLFRLAHRQAIFTMSHERDIVLRLRATPDDLLSWEALCCLKDRPFHPLARAKDWDNTPGAAYAPETAPAVVLHWVGIPRDQVLGAAATGQPIAEWVLDHAQQDALAKNAQACGANHDAYLWLPVHPWQWARLSSSAAPEWVVCRNLGEGPGVATPTASLRSLAIVGRPDTHLKVSLSINALGALRTLPPRYLHNGALAGACLHALRERDPWLASHLLLCDESRWWALRQRDALQSEPGELACLLRRYPSLPGAQLIPMAALPVSTQDGALPAFVHLLGDCVSEDDAWRLFADIAQALLETGLRCFAWGVMPELHGQNILLAFAGRRVTAVVLRDHDTLRICPSLMQARGLDAPGYVIERSTPDTLQLGTPPELLAYLQTLAIEVNLYAILAALAERYDRPETYGWRIVRNVLETVLAQTPLPDEAPPARQLLLDEPNWPFKQVLAPLLARQKLATGMPSSMGRLPNPLLSLDSYGRTQ